jgi:hypothetical protein
MAVISLESWCRIPVSGIPRRLALMKRLGTRPHWGTCKRRTETVQYSHLARLTDADAHRRRH